MNKRVEQYFKETAFAPLDFVFGGILVLIAILYLCQLLFVIWAFTGFAVICSVWIFWRSCRVADSEVQTIANIRPDEWQYPNKLSKGKEQCFYLIDKTLPKKQGIDKVLRTPRFAGLRYYFDEDSVTFEYFIHDLIADEMEIVNGTVPFNTKAKIESESIMTPVGMRDSAFLVINADKEYRIPVDTRDQTTDTLLAQFNK